MRKNLIIIAFISVLSAGFITRLPSFFDNTNCISVGNANHEKSLEFITYNSSEILNLENLLGKDGVLSISENGIALNLIGYDATNFICNNNEQTFLATNQYGGMYFDIPAQYGHVYYFTAYVKSSNDFGGIEFMDDPYFPFVSHSGNGSYERLSIRYKKVLDDDNLLVAVINNGTVFNTISFKSMHVFDLTDIFGNGNEPSMEDMDHIIKHTLQDNDYAENISFEVLNSNKSSGTRLIKTKIVNGSFQAPTVHYFQQTNNEDNDSQINYLTSIELNILADLTATGFINDNNVINIDLLFKNYGDSYKKIEIYNKDELLSEEIITFELPVHEEKSIKLSTTSMDILDPLNMSFQIICNQNVIESFNVIDIIADDINFHWANGTIADLLLKGYAFNKSFKQYSPDEYIHRGELTAMLVKTFNLSSTDYEHTFNDLNNEHTLYKLIQTGKYYGLINGYQDNTIKANMPVTRQDASVIISNGYYINKMSETVDLDLSIYQDEFKISPYALDGVRWCAMKKIMIGKTNDTFEPRAYLTRAEAAVIVDRILDDINR